MTLGKNEQYKLAEYIRRCESDRAALNLVDEIKSDCSHVEQVIGPFELILLSTVMFSMGFMVGGNR